ASGKLVACNVHVAPGLGNAMGSLFNAKFTGTPMILTAGQQEQGHGLTEPLLYDPLVPIVSPLVKWAVEVTRLEDLPRIVRRAAKFAETLGAPVYQQSVAYGAHFLSEHPCFMGGLSRDQKQVRGVLSQFDLLIALGSDPVRMSVWSEVEPLPDGMPVLQIGLIDWDMGKNYPAEMAVRADLRETLTALA